MAYRGSDILKITKKKDRNKFIVHRFIKDDILYKIDNYHLYDSENSYIIYPKTHELDIHEEESFDPTRIDDYYVVNKFTKGEPDVAICTIYLNKEKHHYQLLEKDKISSKELLSFEMHDVYEFFIEGLSYTETRNFREIPTPLGDEFAEKEILINSWQLESLLKHYKLVDRDEPNRD